MKIKCHACKYEWETLSSSFFITCPKCMRKTLRDKKEEQKEANDKI